MRYNQIRSMDVSNGEGVGVALFVQGCPIHCKGCFNTTTWDFDGGKEWTEDIKKKFLELASKPYIGRITILGGEPLAPQNLDGVLDLIKEIRLLFGNTKTIWLYTGYTWEQIFNLNIMFPKDKYDEENKIGEEFRKRKEIVSMCGVLVDGRYEEDKRDISLKFRGSSNQRIIDVKKSLNQNKVVLWCD